MSVFPFTLNDRLGRDSSADTEDVLRVKKRLNTLGFYPIPKYGMTPWTDEGLFEGLKIFQKANGLSVDGFMKPGGPTERKLNRVLGRGPRRGQGIIAKEKSDLREKPGLLNSVPGHEGRSAPERAAGLLQMARQETKRDGGKVSGQKPHVKLPPKPTEKSKFPEKNDLPMIVNPTGGKERNDPDGIGKGWFGASRDGGVRLHKGVDIKAEPEQPVLSPIDGVVKRRNHVYDLKKYPDRKDIKLVEIEGSGGHEGMKIKILYVGEDGPKVGEKIKSGETPLGSAQDIRKTHGSQMTPHIHIEVEWKGQRIDPAKVLPNWSSDLPRKRGK